MADLLRFAEGPREGVFAVLADLGTALRSSVLDADLTGTVNQALIARQERLVAEGRTLIGLYYQQAADVVNGFLVNLAKAEGPRAVQSLTAALGLPSPLMPFTSADLAELAPTVAINGAPIAEWWSKQASDTQARFAIQIRLGVAARENSDQLVARIVGKRTGVQTAVTDASGDQRVFEVRGPSLITTSQNQATGLVRSAVTGISNEVQSQVLQENQDLLEGLQWLATLDPRTCPTCAALDGQIWDMDGTPLAEDGGIPYPGRPGIHNACRCLIIPVVKSYSQLRSEGIDVNPSDPSKLDGEGATTMTYAEWLDGQSSETQDEILGTTKGNLFRDGKLTLADLVDNSGRPLTLAELKAGSK
jgi:SPP1 gp7 family putative phage head morphogenesis protein